MNETVQSSVTEPQSDVGMYSPTNIPLNTAPMPSLTSSKTVVEQLYDATVDILTGKSYGQIADLAKNCASLRELTRKLGYEGKTGGGTRRRLAKILGNAEYKRLTSNKFASASR